VEERSSIPHLQESHFWYNRKPRSLKLGTSKRVYRTGSLRITVERKDGYTGWSSSSRTQVGTQETLCFGDPPSVPPSAEALVGKRAFMFQRGLGFLTIFSMRPLDSDINGIVYTEGRHSGKERNSCVLVKSPAAQE
jgi:hypothetical protein